MTDAIPKRMCEHPNLRRGLPACAPEWDYECPDCHLRISFTIEHTLEQARAAMPPHPLPAVEVCYADPEVQAELELWEATLMDGLEEQDDA